jgi:uncharacterized membrane protein YfcA
MEIYQLLLIGVIAMCGSFIQSVTGFGFGIFAMMFLPHLLMFTEANMTSSILGALTSIFVLITMIRYVDWKNIIFPLAGSFVGTFVAVTFIKSQTNSMLTLLLGIVLFLLSIYFFFFSNKIHIKITWYTGIIAGLLSGIMGGMFAMSGPPAVIYYMQSEKDSKRYLATLSAYFVISNIYSIAIKAFSGFVTVNVLTGLITGVIGMEIGTIVGKTIFKRMNAQMLKKAVYGFMAVSGVVNIITSLTK